MQTEYNEYKDSVIEDHTKDTLLSKSELAKIWELAKDPLDFYVRMENAENSIEEYESIAEEE